MWRANPLFHTHMERLLVSCPIILYRKSVKSRVTLAYISLTLCLKVSQQNVQLKMRSAASFCLPLFRAVLRGLVTLLRRFCEAFDLDECPDWVLTALSRLVVDEGRDGRRCAEGLCADCNASKLEVRLPFKDRLDGCCSTALYMADKDAASASGGEFCHRCNGTDCNGESPRFSPPIGIGCAPFPEWFITYLLRFRGRVRCRGGGGRLFSTSCSRLRVSTVGSMGGANNGVSGGLLMFDAVKWSRVAKSISSSDARGNPYSVFASAASKSNEFISSIQASLKMSLLGLMLVLSPKFQLSRWLLSILSRCVVGARVVGGEVGEEQAVASSLLGPTSAY